MITHLLTYKINITFWNVETADTNAKQHKCLQSPKSVHK